MPCRHRSDFKSPWKRAEGHVCVKWSHYDCNSVDTVPVLPTQSFEGNLVCKHRSKYHSGKVGPGGSGRGLSRRREAVSLIRKTSNKTQRSPSGSPADSWHGTFGSWSYCAKWKKLWADGFLSGASFRTADRTRKFAVTGNRLIVAGSGSDSFKTSRWGWRTCQVNHATVAQKWWLLKTYDLSTSLCKLVMKLLPIKWGWLSWHGKLRLLCDTYMIEAFNKLKYSLKQWFSALLVLLMP